MVALVLADHLLRQQGQCSLWSVGNSPADLLVAPAGGWSRCRGQLEGDSVVVGGVTAAGALTAAMVAAAVAAPNRLTAFAMRLATELPDFAVRARRAGRGAAWAAGAALSSATASLSTGASAAAVGPLAALAVLTLLAAALEALALGADALVAEALAPDALAGVVSNAVLLAATDLPRTDRTLPAGLSTAAAGLDFAADRALAVDLTVDFAVVADEVVADEVGAARRELPGEAGLAVGWRRLLDLAAVAGLAAAVDLAAGVAVGLAAAFSLAAAAGLTAAAAVPRAAAFARLLRPLGAAAAAERLRWESTIAHSASLRLAGLAPWASATLAAFSMSAIRFFQEVAKRLSECDLAPLSIRVSITPAAETFLRRRLKISF